MKLKLSIMLAAKRNEKQLTKKQTAELMGGYTHVLCSF